ncbi:MAG: 1-acyl-sn-glycerol-3-phosphate acyltransferase [Deltaproteobacteria bacterium]|nr:1-acyl-sn-glycerol-3-phosphate acyltransferase [Deltaproteobacteria bacterium]MBW2019289.1 1-acyl-sn-glycerol-3-phosphate acyltransferase [Deltaproteobacteria bacterium]MBW2074090.1 1-acyl-sn-glycerol-3-phosphate acyltransferase [Deltaproteobacteria bacterium]RLB82582.1 MAG: 1-acyl-sn-glycerol-3-phosphate acyltransferase [Deltaproteobacteria bacterium]
MIRTALISAWVILVTFVCALVAIIVSFLKNGGNLSHLVGRFWARSIIFVSRVKVSIQGLEHIDPNATYVYMANHQSMFDILVLLGYLPVQFRWLAKVELFQIPIFGYSMTRVGYISIDRSNRKAAYKSLQEAAQKIAQGVSVVVFPEGTRSPDGQIKPFKGGGFYLAVRSGRPIVPIVIFGSHHVLPKGKLRIRPGRIVLSINPPIETTHYNNNTKEALMELVRSTMKRDLKRISSG